MLPPVAIAILAVVGGVAFHVSALGFAVAVILSAAWLELLIVLGESRAAALTRALPEAIEALQSALVAGLDVPEAISELASLGPKVLRPAFSSVSSALERGYSLEFCLVSLKNWFSLAAADQLIELLILSGSQGGQGLTSMLGELSSNLRAEQKLSGELAAKQGWVAATAKLALLAPWVIVGLLSIRPENAAFYNSQSGAAVLLCGLVLCLIAYIAIRSFAILPKFSRVFADA